MNDETERRDGAGGRRRERFDMVPLAALVGLVALLLAGWWLVPALLSSLKHERCVALGSTSC